MAKLYVDMTQKYGSWTPVEDTHKFEPSGKKVRVIKCRCECGTERLLKPVELVNGDRLSCSECSKLDIRMGSKYGSWTAVREAPKSMGGKVYRFILCRCECGTERLIRSGDLAKEKYSACQRCRRIDIDMTRKYGSWTPIQQEYRTEGGYSKRYILCRCDCGVERSMSAGELTKRESPMCRRCRTIERSTVHGYAGVGRKTSEYITWMNIKQRCHNPNTRAYQDYGARGITVCDRWMESFENFLADMGPKPSPRHSIERVNNDLGYSPDNCKWATRAEQNRNTRANHVISHNGETMCLRDWAKRLELTSDALTRRIEAGWPIEEVLSPVRKERKRMLEHQGRSKCILEWSRETGIPEATIRQRLKLGWTVEKALIEPVRKLSNRRQ